MENKEYIVVLHRDVDYDAVWRDIESETYNLGYIPNRSIAIANNRNMFNRICEYWLTDNEADLIRQDARVKAVEIPVRNNPLVTIHQNATQALTGTQNFTKQAGNVIAGAPIDYSAPLNASINWGLIRHSNQTNPYGPNPRGASISPTTANYNYVPDGTGVDIIINDTGIQANHPEFQNSEGVSRVLNVDWSAVASAVGLDVTTGWNTFSYNDYNGHGTNVAGIASGKTYGWAKNANIIPLYFSTLGESEAEPLDTFEMMIYWHRNKGTNNPTIVNMSWDLRISSYSPVLPVTGGVYRGTPWVSTGKKQSFYDSVGLITLTGNGFPVQDLSQAVEFPYSSAAYNVALGEMIDAGIIVCQAAGNNGFKIDKPNYQGGTGDYDNYILSSAVSGNLYYHRGASPKDSRAIVVGALDTLTSTTAQDQRAPFSCAGPRVDIWAAGVYVMSSCSNNVPDGTVTAPYYLDNNFNELVDTGTSQATPQITGIASLYLQARPIANIYNSNNCSTVKSWLTNNATTTTLWSPGTNNSYTNYNSLLGGNPAVAYQPIQFLTQVKNSSGAWQPVGTVSIKTSDSTWSPVKNIWSKTAQGWRQVF